MDPQAFKQRAMEFIRNKLVVTNDAEWRDRGAVTKVVQFKMQTMLGGNGGWAHEIWRQGCGPNGGGLDQIVRELSALSHARDGSTPESH